MTASVSAKERDTLRRLASRIADISRDPLSIERRTAWLAHDQNTGGRPMVLAHIGGIRDRNPPVPDSLLECETEWARCHERRMRHAIYQFDVLRDDHVVEPRVCTNWQVSTGSFDEQAIRDDIRSTLAMARGCRIELIMKDIHTLNNEPDRLARWVAIARKEEDAT
jgi:hypothetical protein